MKMLMLLDMKCNVEHVNNSSLRKSNCSIYFQNSFPNKVS